MRLPLRNSIPVTSLAIALGLVASVATSDPSAVPCPFGKVGVHSDKHEMAGMPASATLPVAKDA
ncbi:hypothetical protein R5H30_05130 [Sulfitobacter sp. D35]|uniref:hypothetical protein n=1 Tax=Sulfitobacter sp. D35 TaxID=3083252 RepID=UPI00296FA895|nr:hypothetical protein [Sulfitobacter sp. D35]MDW4497356.1 hypothetical protein [Sulfitobacter sp. D35]